MNFRLLLTVTALLALPVLYILNEDISLRPLNPHDHIIQNGLTYAALLLFTYLNHTVFVPRLYLTGRYRRYVGVVALSLFMTAWLPHRIEQWTFLQCPDKPTLLGWAGQLLWKENLFHATHRHHGPPDGRAFSGEKQPPGEGPVRRNFRSGPYMATLPVKLAIIVLLGSVSTLASVSVQTQNRLRQVETDQLQTELRQLKAQIHPHFLFNTLNSIYALAIRKDDRTADTIVKLAEFMRYMIRDAHQHRVPLQNELNYLHNYIDLQQARLRDAVTLQVAIDHDAAGRQIAPLILFTFIENAFKYGVNPDVPSTIRIRIAIEGPRLTLHVFNRKVPTNQLDESTTVGVQNARDRLQLLYPNRHQLRIDDAADTFTVDLTMQLT
ncbi:sensor histidine kinase [Fibrella aestuarina]|uniref:sensor histidine kinase n=1 Tax=Fibrella aestuarina TaxID=651143 RepID=UPI0002F779DD|nr:sensor histidine kinase [Fibrella aestuarina]